MELCSILLLAILIPICLIPAAPFAQGLSANHPLHHRSKQNAIPFPRDDTHDILDAAFVELGNHLERSGLSVDPAELQHYAGTAAKALANLIESHDGSGRAAPSAHSEQEALSVGRGGGASVGFPQDDLVHQVQSLVEKHLLMCAEMILRKATVRCDAAVTHLQNILASSQKQVAFGAQSLKTTSPLATMEANLRRSIEQCQQAKAKIITMTREHEKKACDEQDALRAEIERRREELRQIKTKLDEAFRGDTLQTQGHMGSAESACCRQDKLTDCLLPAMEAAPNPLMQCIETHMCVPDAGAGLPIQMLERGANESASELPSDITSFNEEAREFEESFPKADDSQRNKGPGGTGPHYDPKDMTFDFMRGVPGLPERRTLMTGSPALLYQSPVVPRARYPGGRYFSRFNKPGSGVYINDPNNTMGLTPITNRNIAFVPYPADGDAYHPLKQSDFNVEMHMDPVPIRETGSLPIDNGVLSGIAGNRMVNSSMNAHLSLIQTTSNITAPENPLAESLKPNSIASPV
ncbi:unnamed protein product [Vitrella brassicaformis CCMP3155]|uniref:Uncharacterized protein n=1 Tax=Vitrella brassicaformis (strain CCMP3155) TaxID=1169540 RepID=A0A0G4GR94_VITBC|nr:unnamed protein product [Vitrella brassicaformis CCMP3155]|eukprot:CEM32863.1 unnamed protein product [Vitrella brassicaformis CCMP3155]